MDEHDNSNVDNSNVMTAHCKMVEISSPRSKFNSSKLASWSMYRILLGQAMDWKWTEHHYEESTARHMTYLDLYHNVNSEVGSYGWSSLQWYLTKGRPIVILLRRNVWCIFITYIFIQSWSPEVELVQVKGIANFS